MNVTFRMPNEDLEKAFVKKATAEGLDGLKGHRSVGGLGRRSTTHCLWAPSRRSSSSWTSSSGRAPRVPLR